MKQSPTEVPANTERWVQDSDVSLSPAQHLVWLAQSVAKDIPLYNLTVTYRIHGEVDIARFTSACDYLVRSSDILQSIVIDGHTEEPKLYRDPSISADCEVLTLDSDSDLAAWVAKRCSVPLDPQQKNFDCALIALPNKVTVFYWCQHHISSDGSNIPLVLGYLEKIYQNLGEAVPGAEPVDSIEIPSFFQFVRQLDNDQKNTRESRNREYWKNKSQQVADESIYFGKPFDYSHAKTRVGLKLSEHQYDCIARILDTPGFKSVDRKLSLFTLLATVMMVTGYRLHRGRTLNLGFPTHARRTDAMQNMLGMITGLGFLHLELEPSDTFSSLFKKIMREVMVSFAHTSTGIQTRESQNAYASSLNMLEAEVGTFAGCPVVTEWQFTGFSDSNSQLDLNLTRFGTGDNVNISFDMANTVFSEAERQRYLTVFSRVLDTVLEQRDAVVSSIDILSQAEKEELFSIGCGEPAITLTVNRIDKVFEKQVVLTPDNAAVKQGTSTLSYAQLHNHSRLIAQYLSGIGIGRGDVVGICIKRSIDMYAAILGVIKAEAVFVPLDPTYPDDRLHYMLADSGARLLLTNAETRSVMSLDGTPCIETDAILRGEDVNPGQFANSVNEQTVLPQDALYIMYTSGSTGLPKGVVGTHTATLNRFHWMWKEFPFQRDEICCQKTALSFVDSIWELFGALLQGVPTVVIPDEDVLDIFRFIDVIEREQITRLVLVPSFLAVLLDGDAELVNRLRSLEYCIVSGEPLPLHVARNFLNKLVNCRLLNLYGSTEITADATFDVVSHDKAGVRMPIGKPIAGLSTYVVDDEMNLLPKGCVGELCISGVGLSAGYHNANSLNAEKFVRNPFKGGFLFRTGDLAKYTEKGLLEHHGRRDSQLKIRGHRIESAEIENAVSDLEGIRSATVYVDKNDILYCFYVAALGADTDEDDLLKSLEKRLPAYMIPQLIKIMQIPLLSNGKIDRKGLAQLIPSISGDSTEAAEPRTPTEKALAAIWVKTLGLHQVSIHTDFFDLGGNSIAAMRIMVEAQKAGIAISLKEILDIGNIAELAIEIDNNPIAHQSRISERPSPQADSLNDPGSEDSDSLQEHINVNPAIGGRENVLDIFPLTATQKGILFHLLLQGIDEPLYLAQINCDLLGVMDISVFKEAWNVVAMRHDMLRCVILHEKLAEPVHLTLKNSAIDIDHHDLTNFSEEDARRRCDELSKERLQMPIDISSSPLLRITTVQISAETTHLILDWHHILMDGWSLAVVSNEVLLVYAGLLNQRDHDLPEPGKFRNHVAALTDQNQSLIQQFWREKLSGLDATTPLSDQSDKAEEQFAEANLNVLIDADSSQRLYDFARKCRVTPNTVVQAAWSILLSKYNDTNDVLFGFAVTGRSSGISNYENTVGMFVNSLPMRVKCDGNKTLLDWLQGIQLDQMELVQYENSSLVDIQRASSLPSNVAMFDSLMVFQNVPKLTVSNEFPLDIANRKVHENSPIPLTIEVFPGENLEIQVMYVKEKFIKHSVENIITHFINIIKSISAHESNALVSDIGMMSDEAVIEMSATFNDTARSFDWSADVTDLIWQFAAATPDSPALCFEGKTLDYRELIDQSERLTAQLISKDIGKGDLVAVCLHRSDQLLITLLGILRSGAAYLPLDPDYPQNRIDNILSDADVSLVVTHSNIELSLTSTSAEMLFMDQLGDAEPLSSVHPCSSLFDGHSPAYIIYTSGSTGMPKGVKISRRNMLNFLLSMRERPGMTSVDRLLAVTTVSFDIAVLELFLPLICGASVDIASRETTFDGHALRERIEQQGITMMQATPTTWRLLLAADWKGSDKFRALVGGEALPRDLAAALIPCVSSLWNMYGPTETTVWSTCEQVIDASSTISIGKPIANTEILILDGNDRLCPMAIPGELCIAGAGVSMGYVKRDELTQEKFIPHPLRPDSGELIYRTGDLARWMNDGRLECLGRIDSQVKLRGFRIELGEIEAVIGEAAGVDHAVVNLVKNADSEFLAAYLVADKAFDGVLPNDLTLRELIRSRLPLYMVPSTFIFLDAIPKMPNGKIDRKALPNPNSTAANIAELANIDVFSIPANQPANETEKSLSALWEKALRRDKISVNSNFFDIGGNSISAMQIISACKKQGMNLTIIDIFTLGTIRLCADSIAAGLAMGEAQPSETDAQENQSNTIPSGSRHSADDLERIAIMLKQKV